MFSPLPNEVIRITLIEVKCGDSSRIREKDKTAHRTRSAAVLDYLSPYGGQQDVGHEGVAT